MLAASAFSLVAPGIAAAESQGAGPWGAGLTVGAAILLGAAALLLMDRLLPHEHFIKGREGIEAHRLRRAWLFVFAITLHNLPEGLAIGVGYAGNDPLRGTALATGIAIQDIPEGLVVAVALIAAGYKRAFAVALGMLSGLVEPVGAVLGAVVVGWSTALLPWGLGFAAGAMLFVISHEIIPESHRKGLNALYAPQGARGLRHLRADAGLRADDAAGHRAGLTRARRGGQRSRINNGTAFRGMLSALSRMLRERAAVRGCRRRRNSPGIAQVSHTAHACPVPVFTARTRQSSTLERPGAAAQSGT